MYRTNFMYKCTVQRRYVTLIEMMVVMFLIALIAGALAINLQGSMDEGKVFKTKAGIEKLEAILSLEIAKYPQAGNQIGSNWKSIAMASPMAKDTSILTDGWGEDYQVSTNPETGGVYVYSKKLEEHQRSSMINR